MLQDLYDNYFPMPCVCDLDSWDWNYNFYLLWHRVPNGTGMKHPVSAWQDDQDRTNRIDQESKEEFEVCKHENVSLQLGSWYCEDCKIRFVIQEFVSHTHVSTSQMTIPNVGLDI